MANPKNPVDPNRAALDFWSRLIPVYKQWSSIPAETRRKFFEPKKEEEARQQSERIVQLAKGKSVETIASAMINRHALRIIYNGVTRIIEPWELVAVGHSTVFPSMMNYGAFEDDTLWAWDVTRGGIRSFKLGKIVAMEETDIPITGTGSDYAAQNPHIYGKPAREWRSLSESDVPTSP
jgi:predicted DNA-binding transcriptional regulator YafY